MAEGTPPPAAVYRGLLQKHTYFAPSQNLKNYADPMHILKCLESNTFLKWLMKCYKFADFIPTSLP